MWLGSYIVGGKQKRDKCIPIALLHVIPSERRDIAELAIQRKQNRNHYITVLLIKMNASMYFFSMITSLSGSRSGRYSARSPDLQLSEGEGIPSTYRNASYFRPRIIFTTTVQNTLV